MRKIFAAIVLLIFACVPSWADYDVNTPHVIINQFYGATGGADGYASHSFIELYNPTDSDVNLDGWAVHYRSSAADSVSSDKWYMTELSGTIPSHHSYLIRGAENTGYSGENMINEYDILLNGGGGSSVIYTKGATVILTSNQNEIPSDSEIFDNTTHTPVITGYVDMLSAAGNDYGKAEKENQAPPAYESNFSALMSKKKGVRRVKFQDTDDNSADAEATDYSAGDVSIIFPHSTSFGAWDENTMIVAEINAVKKRVPKFYETYCTDETVSTLSQILTQIDTAISAGDTDSLASLKTSLEEALTHVAYKYDNKIAQVYAATDKGDGTSYGTTLTKAIGYVPAQLVVVDTEGGIMAEDLSWAGQIKVRGNTTSSGAKRPYNVKFSSKVDLFGFGASKKWILLADFYDPTLMRNKTAMDLGKMLGLEATTDCQRVEVWVDGSYRGMYLLTEKIEANENRVNINTKNGDFLIEMDTPSRAEADSVYITTSVLKKFYKMHEPEEPKEDQKSAILNVMSIFETAITSDKWEDVEAVIDVESFVSYYILNEIMKAVDFVWLSVYFYCKDGIMYAGPAWDYDLSSGNLAASYAESSRLPTGLYAGGSHYFVYLMKFTEFQLAVSEKLQELYDSGIIEWTLTDIEADTEFYADAIYRNNSAWDPSVSRGSLQMIPKSTYEENLTYFIDWLSARYDWMTDYFLARTYISSDTFPDSTLLAYAKTLDTDSDSFLSSAEKSAVTSINLSGMNLTSLNLSGLEIFTQLESLDITNNPSLAKVNIRNFPNLSIAYDKATTILIGSIPIFSKHSLVLSGQIGVNFYVTIPEGINTDGAYAEFTVNGITGNPAMLSNAEITEDGDYMFTCYINSVQMADSITAVFHYGNDETITNEYSAKRYLDTVLADSTYSEKLLNLARAVKDLGHYVQEPLSAYNHWVIGEKHQAMDCGNTDIDILSGVDDSTLSDFALVKTLEGTKIESLDETGIKSLMFDLELESETTINIYLYPEENCTGKVNAYLDGSTKNLAVQLQNGSYRITLSGISAHLLGKKYTIHAEAEKNFDIEISALSYAHNVLKSSTDNSLKKAVAALYKYYDATIKYRAED